MDTRFKVGDMIDYGFYVNLKVAGMDDLHYVLQDRSGNTRKIYKTLVDKHGRLIENPDKKG